MSSPVSSTCSICAEPLPQDGGGHCPRCLLGIAQGEAPSRPEGEWLVGSRIGDNSEYEIIAELGEGGMGAVYLAEQQSPVQRTVAIKAIKSCRDSNRLLERFAGERQAIAMMEHPNIASIYDAGLSAKGRPFIVMEWVDGLPIDKYCDAQSLSVKQRIDLFFGVISAIEHAHLKGVAHCDLKPGNILIGGDSLPAAKVIDFGLARAVSPEARSVDSGGEVIAAGTPGFMAPEQRPDADGDVDGRADIFALGAVLRALIGEVELRGNGDLSAIVEKATAADRELRYQAATQLADDLRCYQASQPVGARPATGWYLAGKFAKRHRAAIAVTVFAGVGLVVATIVSSALAVRAHKAEKQAQSRQLQSEELVEFMLDELYGTLKDSGRLEPLSEVAEAAHSYYESIETSDHEKQVIGRSNSLAKIAEIRLIQGDQTAALSAAHGADNVLTEAMEAAPFPSQALRFEVSMRRAKLGVMLRRTEGVAAGNEYIQSAIELCEELLEEGGPMQHEHRSYLAGYYHVLGSSSDMLGDSKSALEWYQKARSVRQLLLDMEPANPARHDDLAEISQDLAKVEREFGRRDEAKSLLDEALRLRSAIPKLHPGQLRWVAHLAKTHLEIAHFHRHGGETEQAMAAAMKSVEIWRDLLPAAEGNTLWLGEYATALDEFVVIAQKAGLAERVEVQAEEVIQLREDLVRMQRTARSSLMLLRSRVNAARVAENQSKYQQALERYRLLLVEAEAVQKRFPDAVPRDRQGIENALGVARRGTERIGRYLAEAEPNSS